jgi:predicted RNA binding protein YcfA (HicA-like mRNA interferase family)
MPRKVRQLESDLRRAGFVLLPGRGQGSHRQWRHPAVPGATVTVAGNPGDDADHYQERDVRDAIRRVEEARP